MGKPRECLKLDPQMGLEYDDVSDGFVKQNEVTCLGAVYFLIGNEFVAVLDMIS